MKTLTIAALIFLILSDLNILALEIAHSLEFLTISMFCNFVYINYYEGLNHMIWLDLHDDRKLFSNLAYSIHIY